MTSTKSPTKSPKKTLPKPLVTVGEASGSALCKQLAVSLLDDYTEQLIDMVENSTHGLSIDDIRSFHDRYKINSIDDDTTTFKTHFQRCLNRREQEVFDPNRREPFKRVLTMRFVDMFPPEGGLGDSGAYISRRVLPGLFLVLEKMVGSDPFINGLEACKDVIGNAKDDNGVVVWENVYGHAAALEAVDELLMRLVTHFDNPMKRMMWMLDLINNDLSDPLEFDFEGAANKEWQLDEGGLINILRHLFRNLRHRLKDKAQAQDLATKYGQRSARQLVALIKALDRAEV